MRGVVTVILAGGKGTRLEPLTRDRAKPAVPFGGLYRIIDFTLSNCLNSGLRRVLVLTQFKSRSLDRHIRHGWGFLSSELGESVEVLPPQQRIDETWYKGTADAIYQNIYSIERERAEHVLILAGDHIYKMDYGHMIRAHMVLLSTDPWGWVVLGGPLPMPEALPGCYEGQVPWDVQFPASVLLLGPRADALLMGIHVRDAKSSLVHVGLGAPLVDVLAQVTEQACSEAEAGGALHMAPAAPEDMQAGKVLGSHFSDKAWRTSEGKTIPACKRWTVMDSGALDGLLVPMLH